MPDGFDTAIVIEHVTVSDDEQHVRIDAAPSARFAGTRAPGSQMKRGDVLARAGEIVNADVAARIATGNVTAVPVRVKPKVAFIPTGDELVVPGGPIEAGRNIETNSLVFRGKVEKWGGVPMVFDIVPDDPEQIKAAIRRACAMADIVVLNAGSSKGSEDWNCEQMEESARFSVTKRTTDPVTTARTRWWKARRWWASPGLRRARRSRSTSTCAR